ncbi:hypothetical protein ACVI1N_000383 [Sinorhizobium medicae]
MSTADSCRLLACADMVKHKAAGGIAVGLATPFPHSGATRAPPKRSPHPASKLVEGGKVSSVEAICALRKEFRGRNMT